MKAIINNYFNIWPPHLVGNFLLLEGLMHLPALPPLISVSGREIFRVFYHLPAALLTRPQDVDVGIITLKVKQGTKKSRGLLGSHRKEDTDSSPGSGKQGLGARRV